VLLVVCVGNHGNGYVHVSTLEAQMNKDCEKIVGPCSCGAWHSEDDVLALRDEIRETFIPGLGTVRACIDCVV